MAVGFLGLLAWDMHNESKYGALADLQDYLADEDFKRALDAFLSEAAALLPRPGAADGGAKVDDAKRAEGKRGATAAAAATTAAAATNTLDDLDAELSPQLFSAYREYERMVDERMDDFVEEYEEDGVLSRSELTRQLREAAASSDGESLRTMASLVAVSEFEEFIALLCKIRRDTELGLEAARDMGL